jgi:hypothetical protein
MLVSRVKHGNLRLDTNEIVVRGEDDPAPLVTEELRRRAQDLREKALVDAQKALNNASRRLKNAKNTANFTDSVYRSIWEADSSSPDEVAFWRRSAQKHVKKYLRRRREWMKAVKSC